MRRNKGIYDWLIVIPCPQFFLSILCNDRIKKRTQEYQQTSFSNFSFLNKRLIISSILIFKRLVENKMSLSLLLNRLEHFLYLSKQALTLKLNKRLNINASHANHFIFEKHTKSVQPMPRTYCTATWKDTHEKFCNVIGCNLNLMQK